MAEEKIENKIKKKEKQVKQIFQLKGIDYKEWYLNQLNLALEENLDSLFELIEK